MLSWEKTSKTSKKLVRFVYRGVDEEDGEGILANSIIDHLYFANIKYVQYIAVVNMT